MPAAIVKPRRQMPKKGSKTEAILTLTATTPATPTEIAESVNTSRQLVHQVLERYGINPNTAESYKEYKADILAGLQEKILSRIDPVTLKIETARDLKDAMTGFGILVDKERLERGQPSAIIGHGFALSAPLQEAVDRVIERLSPLPQVVEQNNANDTADVEDIVA